VLQYVEEKEKLEEKHLLPHTIVGEKKGESKVLNKVSSAGAVLRSRSPKEPKLLKVAGFGVIVKCWRQIFYFLREPL
jgi:hypothetical protein